MFRIRKRLRSMLRPKTKFRKLGFTNVMSLLMFAMVASNLPVTLVKVAVRTCRHYRPQKPQPFNSEVAMSDYETDLQPDCFICGQQLFDDDLQNALDHGGISIDHACSACLAAADSLGHGYED